MLDCRQMAIDDQIEALLKQLEADKRERHPMTDVVWLLGKAFVSAKLSFFPGVPKVLDKIEAFLKGDARDNQMLLLVLVCKEMQSIQHRLAQVSEEHRDFLAKEFPGLLMNAFKRVEWVRAKTRIQRLANVLRAAIEEGPTRSGDESEEYMRITLEMGDEDILVLAALSDYKPPTVEAGIKNISDFKVAGIQSENLESVLSKLQSYGLIAYIPEGITGISTADYPFRVLPRGRKFLAAIRDTQTDDTT